MDPELSKTESIDLGLALLAVASIRGVPLTAADIAIWCDCSPQRIRKIEEQAMRKLRRRLLAAGIVPEVFEITRLYAPPPPLP